MRETIHIEQRDSLMVFLDWIEGEGADGERKFQLVLLKWSGKDDFKGKFSCIILTLGDKVTQSPLYEFSDTEKLMVFLKRELTNIGFIKASMFVRNLSD